MSPVWVLLLFYFWVVNPSRCFLYLYTSYFISFDCCLLFSICVFISLCVASVALASSCLGRIPSLIELPSLRFMRLPLVCFYCLCDFVSVFHFYRDGVLCWLLSCPFSYNICFPSLSPIPGLICFGSVYLVTTAGFVADQLMM